MTVMKEVVGYQDIKGMSKGSSEESSVNRQENDILEEKAAEPIKENLLEESAKEETKQESVKPNYEEEARAKGWKPKEEFEGDPEDWAPAKAWLKTGEILDSLHNIKRESKETKEALEALAKQNAEVERKAYEKAYRDAEAKQAQAAEVGNVKMVQEATKAMMELAPKAGVAPAPVPTGRTPEAENFIVENRSWFNTDTPENAAMHAFALATDKEVATKYKDLSNAKKLEIVKDEVRKAFPHRFPSNVSKVVREVLPAGTAAPKKVSGDDFARLPEHHKRIMRKLERDLGSKFNKAAYIQNVKLIGDL